MTTKAGKGNRTVSVIMSEDTYEALRLLAMDKDWSISQTARKLIELGLDNGALDKPKP